MHPHRALGGAQLHPYEGKTMTYTAEQLHLLALSDATETGRTRRSRPTGKPMGRPRTAPDTPRQQRHRARTLARYYRLKSTPTTES